MSAAGIAQPSFAGIRRGAGAVRKSQPVAAGIGADERFWREESARGIRAAAHFRGYLAEFLLVLGRGL